MWFVEIIRALAWPIAVVTIALVYRDLPAKIWPAVSAWIDRRPVRVTNSILGSIELGVAQQQVTPEVVGSEAVAVPIQGLALPRPPLILPPPPPALAKIDAYIDSQLAIWPAEDEAKWLKRDAAMMRLKVSCAETYIRIFGSQISYLKALNTAGNKPKEFARSFYEYAAGKHPEEYVN